MGDWENLPPDIFVCIYSYLSRRDRLSCSLVCDNWKYGLDHIRLWKDMIVHIDVDLMEPSTTFMMRDYCKYVRNLEFGWAVPYRNTRWLPLKYKEMTKRAVRFFLILHDSFVQIKRLRIFNWLDYISFQKVIYHLTRFLKNQYSLEKIVFENMNIHSANYNKILTSCLNSRDTITHLDIKYCYYFQDTFEPVFFQSCMEQLRYLKIFKLDYYILSCELIDAILVSRNCNLEHLEVILKEEIWKTNAVVDEEQWCLLSSCCPKLKVTLDIQNVYHFGDLATYLKQSIPLASLSVSLPRMYLDQGGRCNFRRTLNLIVNTYYRTLEVCALHIKNEGEVLDDLLLMMIRRCYKLKTLIYNGIMENPKLMQTHVNEVSCSYMVPNYNPEKLLIFDEVYSDAIPEVRNKRVQFQFTKSKSGTHCNFMILN